MSTNNNNQMKGNNQRNNQSNMIYNPNMNQNIQPNNNFTQYNQVNQNQEENCEGYINASDIYQRGQTFQQEEQLGYSNSTGIYDTGALMFCSQKKVNNYQRQNTYSHSNNIYSQNNNTNFQPFNSGNFGPPKTQRNNFNRNNNMNYNNRIPMNQRSDINVMNQQFINNFNNMQINPMPMTHRRYTENIPKNLGFDNNPNNKGNNFNPQLPYGAQNFNNQYSGGNINYQNNSQGNFVMNPQQPMNHPNMQMLNSNPNLNINNNYYHQYSQMPTININNVPKQNSQMNINNVNININNQPPVNMPPKQYSQVNPIPSNSHNIMNMDQQPQNVNNTSNNKSVNKPKDETEKSFRMSALVEDTTELIPKKEEKKPNNEEEDFFKKDSKIMNLENDAEFETVVESVVIGQEGQNQEVKKSSANNENKSNNKEIPQQNVPTSTNSKNNELIDFISGMKKENENDFKIVESVVLNEKDSIFPVTSIQNSIQIKEDFPADFHIHPLEKESLFLDTCSICLKQMSSPAGYKCQICALIICNDCAEYIKVNHLSHNKHEHDLSILNEGKCHCNKCKKNVDASNFYLICQKCGYNLCLNCYYPERNDKSTLGQEDYTPVHEHPLELVRDLNYSYCQLCEKNIKDGYKCYNCDLVLCQACSKNINSRKARKELHMHKVFLTIRRNWKCEICSREFKEKISLYCDKCSTDFCIDCFLL